MFELITETYKLFKDPLISSFQFYSLVMNYIIIRLTVDGGGSDAYTQLPGIDVFMAAIQELQSSSSQRSLKQSYITNMARTYCVQILRKDPDSPAGKKIMEDYSSQTGPFHLVLIQGSSRGSSGGSGGVEFPRTMKELYDSIQKIRVDSTQCTGASDACGRPHSSRSRPPRCKDSGRGQIPNLNQHRVKPMKTRTKKNHKKSIFSIRKPGVKISTKNKQRKNTSKKQFKKQSKKQSKKQHRKQTQKHKTYNQHKNKSNKNKNTVFRK